MPKAGITGKVEFDLAPDLANKTLTLKIKDLKPESKLVGKNSKGLYLQVPKNTIVEIELILSDTWKWSFKNDDSDFTLSTKKHKEYYFVKPNPSSDQTRTIIIKPSGNLAYQDPQSDKGGNDEKFNLTVELEQAGATVPLVIEIDPITKNPPPDGGKIVTDSNPLPLM